MASRLLLPLALLASCLLASAAGGGNGGAVEVKGRVVVPEGITLAGSAEVVLSVGGGGGGRRLKAFPLQDGGFSFPRVPPGEHTLEVNAVGLVFPTLRLEVTSKPGSVGGSSSSSKGSGKGSVAATLTDIAGGLEVPYPLLLRPIARAEYFDKRQPLNILAYLKTPYGMMIAFMVFSMVVLPKLKVDPEEYKAMMEETSNLKRSVLSGGSSGGGGGGGGGGTRRIRD